MKFWVNVVSREHVEVGVAGGFTQADHGKPTRLRRLGDGDGLVFYSPRTAMRSGEQLQQFTAVGRVGPGLQQVEMTPQFHPWRREVQFRASEPAPIAPLRAELTFLPAGSHWGVAFRRGLFEIPEQDFRSITDAMGAPWPKN